MMATFNIMVPIVRGTRTAPQVSFDEVADVPFRPAQDDLVAQEQVLAQFNGVLT